MLSSTSGVSSLSGFYNAITELSAKQKAGQSFADALSIASQQNGASSSENELDTITLSGTSGTAPALAKSEMILPTMKNVRILSSALKDELGSFFLENDISSQPPVELSVNSEGKIVVKGDRDDTERIENFLNNNDKLADDIRTLNAIAEEAYILPRHLQFQAEYRASNNPEAVVAKYSDLFNPRPHSYSMRFGAEQGSEAPSDNLELLVDGKAWSQTNIPLSAWIDESINKIINTAENTVADTNAGLVE